MADEGLNFAIGLSIDELRAKGEQAKEVFREIGKMAVDEGRHIDEVFKELGKDSGIDLNTAPLEAKLDVLRVAIRTASDEARGYEIEVAKLGEQMSEALSKGDTTAYETLNAQLVEAQEKMVDASVKAEDYKRILNELSIAAGNLRQSAASMTLYFGKEKDYENYKKLQAKIAELRDEMANAPSVEEWVKLNEELIETEQKLSKMQKEASAAAQSLGTELGGKAADASAQLYQLNAAVKEQKQTLKELEKQLNEAADALKKAQEAGDSGGIATAQERYRDLAKEVDNARTRLDNLNGAQQDAAANWQNVSGQISQHNSVLVKMLGGTEKYSKVMAQLPAPMQQMVGGLNNMTGAAKAFIATPLGAILAALILAYQAIKTAVNSSAEGQRNFAIVSGYVTGVLDQLKEVVITVGNILLKMFVKPKEAGEDFMRFINDKVLGTLKDLGKVASSLGNLIISVFSFDKNALKKASDEFGETWKETFGAKFEKLNENAQERASINIAEQQLRKSKSAWEIAKAKLEAEKSELNALIYDSSKSQEERQKAMERYEELIDRIAKTEIGYIDQEIALQKRRMALTSNTIEDEEKLNSLYAQRERLKAQQTQEHAATQRRKNSINTAGDTEQNREDAIADETLKLQRDRQQAEIDLMAEGTEKKIAAINLAYDKEMDAIAKRERELRQKQNGELTEEQQDGIKVMTTLSVNKKEANVKQVYEDALADYRTFEQQRLAIAEEYARRRADVIAAGGTQENVDSVNQQEGLDLSALLQQSDAEYNEWLGKINNATVLEMQKMLKVATDALKKMPKNLTKEQQKEADRLKAKIAELERAIANANLTPKKASNEQWSKWAGQIDELGSAFNDLGDAIGGTAGEIISGIGDVMNSTANGINAACKLAEGGLNALETASVILAIVTAAVKVAKKIYDLVKSNQEKKAAAALEEYQKKVDNITKAYERLERARDKALGTNKTKAIAQQIEEQNKLLDAQIERRDALQKKQNELKNTPWYSREWFKLYDLSDKEKKELEQLSDDIEATENSLEDLHESITEAIFGQDVQSAITDLSNALVEAWDNGTSAAATAEEYINKMVKNMAQQTLQAMIQNSGAVQRLMKDLQAYYNEFTRRGAINALQEGVSAAMQLQSKSFGDIKDSFADSLKGYYDMYDDLMRNLGIESEAQRSGSSKGIAQASQESIDETNGRMTAIQGHTFSINENTQIIRDNISAINSSVSAIEGYTQHLVRMDDDLHRMQVTLNDMQTQGVKIQ